MTEGSICALATPAGGAIGVIRVSGNDAIAMTDRVFRAANGKSLAESKANTIRYGEIKDKAGNTIDDVLVSVFRAPHSYTGEDSTEISCHGSRYILQQVLQCLVQAGCRHAQPGEYTRRAYMNGKMDLSQAEAVADLIASTNKATHDMAMSQLKGHFSSELSKLREKLLKMNSLLELELDFSDHEELEFADRKELKQLAEQIEKKVTSLAHSFETGNALKQGIPVAIVGKTNVGKSTLLNRLLNEDKAIVSDVEGTTRDVIEDTTEIDGITFRFIDTAGIRKTTDKVEKMGIDRTYQKMEEAQILLILVDGIMKDNDERIDKELKDVMEIMESSNCGKVILGLNKFDDINEYQGHGLLGTAAQTLVQQINQFNEFQSQRTGAPMKKLSIVPMSAKLGYNIEGLKKSLVEFADIPEITENDVIVTSARHYEALTRADESLQRVLESMDAGMSGDIIAEDLKMVLEALGEITGGQISSLETLNNIFKHFCIGK